MNTARLATGLLAATTATALLTACGSDSPPAKTADSGARPSTSSSSSTATAAAKGGGDISGPCDVTDQATVASVFSGAGAGKAGQVRNCEYSFASGPVSKVNVFLYKDTTLELFKKEDKDNGITFSTVQLADGAIRDQLHTLTVQQGDTLFSVQALPRDGLSADKLAAYDPQTLALAKKIAANL